MAGLYTALPWRGVDIVNWDAATAPSGAPQIGDGDETLVFYAGDRQLGRLIIADGGALSDFEDESYDVVFEHFADPLRALRAWMRVLRPGGALFLSVPWAPNTYDRNVPVSTIYDLALAYDDDADGAVLAPEAERYWRTRVETYDRLVDRENCPFLPAVFHEELQESVSCPT
ncbi:hypothetical protein JL720_11862 [Aureococcus anophagefferens]|nr:hypothetical protein JL720_11862 [Aureococcus anophagefferens]